MRIDFRMDSTTPDPMIIKGEEIETELLQISWGDTRQSAFLNRKHSSNPGERIPMTIFSGNVYHSVLITQYWNCFTSLFSSLPSRTV